MGEVHDPVGTTVLVAVPDEETLDERSVVDALALHQDPREDHPRWKHDLDVGLEIADGWPPRRVVTDAREHRAMRVVEGRRRNDLRVADFARGHAEGEGTEICNYKAAALLVLTIIKKNVLEADGQYKKRRDYSFRVWGNL